MGMRLASAAGTMLFGRERVAHRAAGTGKEDTGSMSEASNLTPAQQAMADLWDKHMEAEFASRSVEQTLETMVEDQPYVNHVPVLTGGVGLDEVRKFYSERFIPQQPPDTEIVPLSRTVGNDRVVDELISRFTHTIAMDWLLPGIPPTGRRVEIPLVVVVQFREGKIASEHIYWDQASVLVQVGLIDPETLPVAGSESARKVRDPTSVPSNGLMERVQGGQ
jgi:carboxymethylenebutenolidase